MCERECAHSLLYISQCLSVYQHTYLIPQKSTFYYLLAYMSEYILHRGRLGKKTAVNTKTRQQKFYFAGKSTSFIVSPFRNDGLAYIAQSPHIIHQFFKTNIETILHILPLFLFLHIVKLALLI